VFLAIRNNGQKVLPQDRPFLFDKSFIDSQSQRQKATGMGLYLAGQLVLEERADYSFAIKLLFPDHY
jgi:signal transduction histidine kinase